ncbi:MAG: IS1380 family transposase [Lachnospiraceae bacterium]|nr:IS1380 family transposase [Lachnospiraceae bacterium]
MVSNIEVVLTDERILPSGGLSLVGCILEKDDFIQRMNTFGITGKRSGKQIKDGDILTSFIALACMGKPDFDAIRELKDDPEFFKEALGLTRIPSSEILRQRMDEIGDSKRNILLNENIRILRANGVSPTKHPCGYIPVDLDVTPQDNSKTHKQGVSRTYKGYDGFAPMMCYIGTEGYLLNAELRPGSQHSQNGTPDFLRQSIALARKLTLEPLMFRLDSGNDASENIGIFTDSGCSYIIKRNLRRENHEKWLKLAKSCCKDITKPRDGKTVYTGSTWKEVSYKTESQETKTTTVRVIYEITERMTDKHGQYLLEPEVEIDTWWTNLPLSDREIIELYHAHGECEQYHSEFKTDMDLERLPSEKFATNALVIELGMIAYNILRMIGQESLGIGVGQPRHKVRRRRLRTVINDLIMMACHVTRHARRLRIGLGKSNFWRQPFLKVFNSFAQFDPMV